jgi:hypothetical protein
MTGTSPTPVSAATSFSSGPRIVPEGTISGRMFVGMPRARSMSVAQAFLRGSYIWLVVATENSLLWIPVKSELNRSGMNSSVPAASRRLDFDSTIDSTWYSVLICMNCTPVVSKIFSRGTRANARSIMPSVRVSR